MSMSIWHDNIEMNLEGVFTVRMVMNLGMRYDEGNTSTSSASFSFLKGTLLSGVGVWVKGKVVPLCPCD
jgi:hypothetical protein